MPQLSFRLLTSLTSCTVASGAVGQLEGDSPDDGYFHMDLQEQFGISFPFMVRAANRSYLSAFEHRSQKRSCCVQGRAEHELYISANGCELASDF